MCFTVAGCGCPRRIGRGSVFYQGEVDHYGDNDLERGDQFVELGRAVVNRVVAPPIAPSAAVTTNPVVYPAFVHGVVWNAGVRNSLDPCRNARAQLDPKLDSGVLHGGGREGARDVVVVHTVRFGAASSPLPVKSRPRTLCRGSF